MGTAEKIRILRSKIDATVTIAPSEWEEIQAYILQVDGEGDDTICTFMDVMEGVERSLSVTEIDDIRF